METSCEILEERHDGGESSTQGRGGRHRRRRPLHHHACCLLLFASSSPSPCMATDDDASSLAYKPSLRQGNRHLSNKVKLCPNGYTGKAPTAKCSGYVSCRGDGTQSGAVQLCASGTQFDIKSNTCTWPDKVDCKVGDDLIGIVQISSDATGGDAVGDYDPDAPSLYCPERYTGRAPTENCRGYVQCNKGREGISANCPPRTKFSTMTSLCEYNLPRCEMLVGESPDESLLVGVNALARYCPEEYTGRAPTAECRGYVDCKNGVARRSKLCPSGTTFDIMILACTYGATGCDVLLDAEPTQAPVTNLELRQSMAFRGCAEEEDNFVGYIPEPGCQSYIYCQSGKEVNRFECAEGTLYNGQYCTWADSVSCDTTRIPTSSPSYTPTGEPTEVPTYTPTQMDLSDASLIYYPKFSDGTCRNDGNFPTNVGSQYLFSSSERCCESYFPTNMDKCLRASVPSPAPTPSSGKREWFPDYQTGICKNDGSYGQYETNFFWTYEECCNFDWIEDPVRCLRNRPTVAYYPDYERDACLSDGQQSPFEMNLFDSLEECCRFKWIDYGLCINGGRKVDEDETGVWVETGFEYYPDQDHNVCNCDGRQSKHEINIFSSYEECCNFQLIDTSICLQYKMYIQDTCVQPPSSSLQDDPVWYPDRWNGLCRNDGMEPSNVELTTSYQICCKRFFPGTKQDCRAKSEAVLSGEYWGPSPTPGSSNNQGTSSSSCTGLRPRQCSNNSACRYDIGLDKCVARAGWNNSVTAPSPTTNSCSDLSSKRSCNKQSSCTWNLPDGPCLPATAEQVTDPSPSPPTSSSSSSNNNNDLAAFCNSLTNDKKICVRDARCAWQKPSGPCIAANSQIGNGSVPPPPSPRVESSPSSYSGNPYYADYFNNICLNDGRHKNGDDTFETVVDCCRDPWVEYKTCIKHARSTGMIPGSGNGGSDNSNGDASNNDASFTAASDSNPYYPDYFYNICRNDGNQSPMEANLFGKLRDCCRVQYIDYDSCMSNAGS